MGRACVIVCSLVLVGVTGCSGTPTPGVDAGDDDGGGGGDDGGGNQGGLTFRFLADPDLPTDKDGAFEVEITSAAYDFHDIRAIGDAAPGDSRTSRTFFPIDLREDRILLPFPDAPQGIYSFLLADIDYFVVRGKVRIDGISHDFEIEDTPPGLELSLDLGGLELGDEPQTCTVAIDLRPITRVIDWQPLAPTGDDEIEIHGSYPDIALVRDAADDWVKQ